VGLAIKHCPRRRVPHPGHQYTLGTAHGSGLSDASNKETISTFSRPSPQSEERNPDLIPLKDAECEYQLEVLRVPSCQVVSPSSQCQLGSNTLPAHSRAHIIGSGDHVVTSQCG
ncbi:unnamed protein product, partial [Meganyctiphanes norvegica]